MKILLVSFGIMEYDGRLQELINVAKNIGEVSLCCCTRKNDPELCKIEGSQLSIKTYWSFLRYVIRKSRKVKYDVILADNLFASIPVIALLILRKKPQFIIQDVRELYFTEKMHGKSKFFAWFERKLMHKSDVILCANNERADIMFKEFGLKKRPLVFENIRFLNGEYNEKELDEKYKDVFKYSFNLISTSGLFMARDTDKLIESMKDLDERFGLFFIGNSDQKDIDIMNKITQEHNIKNVHLLGKVPLNELVYIVRKCQIGLVHYHKRDLNNLYCASGKIYEFLHEGLPIVTTENPPLKSMCEKYSIGIADDTFSGAIRTIADNYSLYQQNVKDFISNISVEEYNRSISESIVAELGGEAVE